jgi:hypothetical protein
MRIENIDTGEKRTIKYQDFYILGLSPAWKDITPPRSDKQNKQSERFVKLGMLHRTLQNMMQVENTFGLSYDMLIAQDLVRKLIKQVTNTKS